MHCSLSNAQLFRYFLSMSPFKHFDFSLSYKVLKTYQQVKCLLPGPQCVQTNAVGTLPGTCKFLKLIAVDTAFNTVSASGRWKSFIKNWFCDIASEWSFKLTDTQKRIWTISTRVRFAIFAHSNLKFFLLLLKLGALSRVSNHLGFFFSLIAKFRNFSAIINSEKAKFKYKYCKRKLSWRKACTLLVRETLWIRTFSLVSGSCS